MGECHLVNGPDGAKALLPGGAGHGDAVQAGELVRDQVVECDPALLAVTLLPQLAALIGYAFWLGDLEAYYYVSLMPAAVLTMLLGVSSVFRLATYCNMAMPPTST